MLDALKFPIKAQALTSDAFNQVKRQLSGVKGALAGVNDHAMRLGRGMRKIGGGMTAGLTAPIVGLGALAVRATDSTLAMQDQARVAGLTTQRFFEVSAAARQFGVDQEKTSDILKDVNDKFGDYLQTGAGPLRDFFDNIAPKVGLTKEAFADLSSDQSLALYVSSLEKAGLSQKEMTFYMEALASDSTALLPIFRENSAEITRVTEAAARFGLVLDEDTINAARRARGELGVMGTLLRTKLSASLAELMPAFSELLKTAVPALEKLVSKVGEGVTWFNELSQPVKKLIGITGALALATGPLVAGLGFVVMGLSALMGPVGLAVLGLAAVGVGAVALARNWDSLKERYPALIGGLEKFGGALKAAVGSYAQSAKKIGTGLLQGFEALASGDLIGMFKSFSGVTKDLVLAPFRALDAALGGFSGKVATWGGELLASLKGRWSEVRAETTRWVSDFAAAGGALVQSLLDGIQAKWSEAKEAVRELGRNVAEGFSEGISGGIGWVKDSAGRMAQAAIDKGKAVLGVNSPSRVFMGIGGSITEGLKMGVEDGTPGVTGAIEGLLSGVDEVKGKFAGIADAVSGSMNSIGSMIGQGIRGLKSWGEVLAGVLGQIGSSLWSAGLSSFGGALSGIAGPGVGNFITGLLGGLTGFANGGSFKVGGSGGVDSQLVAFRASPDETVSITRPDQMRNGGGMVYAPVIDARGADAGAVARIERVLARDSATFEARVVKAVGRARNNRVLA